MQYIYEAVGDKIREIFHDADLDIRILDPDTGLSSSHLTTRVSVCVLSRRRQRRLRPRRRQRPDPRRQREPP